MDCLQIWKGWEDTKLLEVFLSECEQTDSNAKGNPLRVKRVTPQHKACRSLERDAQSWREGI